MSKKKYIYILSTYANEKHAETYSDSKIEELRIGYKKDGIQVTIIERNSLVEEEYGLTLKSAKYLAEGNRIKESMIHHHNLQMEVKKHFCKLLIREQ